MSKFSPLCYHICIFKIIIVLMVPRLLHREDVPHQLYCFPMSGFLDRSSSHGSGVTRSKNVNIFMVLDTC